MDGDGKLFFSQVDDYCRPTTYWDIANIGDQRAIQGGGILGFRLKDNTTEVRLQDGALVEESMENQISLPVLRAQVFCWSLRGDEMVIGDSRGNEYFRARVQEGRYVVTNIAGPAGRL